MSQKRDYISFRGESLGDVEFAPQDFPSHVYKEIESEAFLSLPHFQKHERISAILFEAIQKEKEGVFLLPHVIQYITRVRSVLPTYHLTSFEFWLNHYGGAKDQEKMHIRGKIVGKWLPRSEYQNFFPIQKGESFPGSHYSYAHISPDLDTTTASFACFLAAFGAKVGEGRHHWVVPGGPPKESMEIEFFFKRALGENLFSAVGSSSTKFVLSAMDLISQKNIIRKMPENLTYDIDPERGRQAVILVDERGCYLGDWRSVDVDPVRSIIIRFRSFLTEYQNRFTLGIITLFSKTPLTRGDWEEFLQENLSVRFSSGTQSRELTEKQRKLFNRFIQKVLFIEKGCEATVLEIFKAMEGFGFSDLIERLEAVATSVLFDSKGLLIENRSLIFKELEEIFALEKAVFEKFFLYIDSLQVAMEVKRSVFEKEPTYLSHLAEYEEIVGALKDYHHLTVNYYEKGNCYPLGVIYADDVKRKVIATTSWNDFSNPSETDLAEGVEVISFIDHHKSNVTTARPAFGVVRADAQSSNSIIARISFEMNDRYSTGGMTIEKIEERIKEVSKQLEEPRNVRLLQRLLQKKNAAKTRGVYAVSREREMLEYLQYVFAILDDTDLLTKVTEYDIDGMASLLNRLKSLMLRDEVEVVHFDDLQRSDPDFPKKAAKKLLQTRDLYSLYGVIYQAKEKALEKIILETAKGLETPFFQDTKVLGSSSYAAVGQFKHFVYNAKTLHKEIQPIRNIWLKKSEELYKERPEIFMHILMLSTVASAEELFSEVEQPLTYLDELWFWIPDDKKAEHHLKNFLQEFHKSGKAERQQFQVEFCGKAVLYEKIFAEAFTRPFTKIHTSSGPSMAILKVTPGSIKSRKTDIAVYL